MQDVKAFDDCYDRVGNIDIFPNVLACRHRYPSVTPPPEPKEQDPSDCEMYGPSLDFAPVDDWLGQELLRRSLSTYPFAISAADMIEVLQDLSGKIQGGDVLARIPCLPCNGSGASDEELIGGLAELPPLSKAVEEQLVSVVREALDVYRKHGEKIDTKYAALEAVTRARNLLRTMPGDTALTEISFSLSEPIGSNWREQGYFRILTTRGSTPPSDIDK